MELDARGVEEFRLWYRLHTGKMLTRSNASRAIRAYLAAVPPPPSPAENDLVGALGGHTVEQLTAKILRRYEPDVPEVKQFLRPGEDRVLLARISSLSSELEKAREALKPFAERQFHATMVDSDHVWTVTYRDKDKAALTVSHFRAACAALKDISNGK